jgi:hypothetical protein
MSNSLTLTVSLFTDEQGKALSPGDVGYGDVSTVVSFPAKYELCHGCGGRGRQDHPSFNGLTSEDFREDPDMVENYGQGLYDATCETCKGLRVVLVGNEDLMTIAEREDYQVYLEQEADNRQWDRLDAKWAAAGF